MKSENNIFSKVSKDSEIKNYSDEKIIDGVKDDLAGRIKEAYLFGGNAISEKSARSDIDTMIVMEIAKSCVEST